MMALGDPRGHPGVLIMCDQGREQRAMHDVADLMNEALEEEGGGAAGEEADVAAEGSPAPVYRSVAEELEAELAELGAAAGVGGGGGRAPFAAAPGPLRARFASKIARFVELGCRGVGLVWLSKADADVTRIIHGVMEKALATHTSPLRSVMRLLPLAAIVGSNSEAVVAVVKKQLGGIVRPAGAATYRIELRVRNNSGFDSAKAGVLKDVSGMLREGGWSRHEDAPHIVVLIEAIKAFAGVSVLLGADWARYSKYNVRVAAETEEDREARLVKARAVGGAGKIEQDGEEEGEGSGAPAGPSVAPALTAAAQRWVPAAKRPRTQEAPPAATHVVGAHGGQFTLPGGAHLDYEMVEGGVVEVTHTFTPPEGRGGGAAALLCDAAFVWARAEGRPVRPLCTYVSGRYVTGQAEALRSAGWVLQTDGGGIVTLLTPRAA